MQALIFEVWQPVEREFVNGRAEEAADCPDVCFGFGNDILGGDWKSMLNLNVFRWLLLLWR